MQECWYSCTRLDQLLYSRKLEDIFWRSNYSCKFVLFIACWLKVSLSFVIIKDSINGIKSPAFVFSEIEWRTISLCAKA